MERQSGGAPLRWRLQLSTWLCAWSILCALPAAARAQTALAAPLALAEAEVLALAAEPGQLALNAEAEALAAHAVAARALPDPELRLALANYPIESGGFSTEGMTQAQVGLRQSFPAGRSRAVLQGRFDRMSAERTQRADARAREVLGATRMAWLEAFYWQRAHAIVTESRPFFEDLVTVTRSLYSLGNRDQQDLLRAELELSRLEERLIDINRQRAHASASLSEWIGAAAARDPVSALPTWSPPASLAQLRESLLEHPLLAAAGSRIAVGDSGVDLARERYKPGWDLDLGYGYREGELANGDSRSDFVSVALTFDLPLFTRNRQDRTLAAAVSERAAAAASRDVLLRRLRGRLDAEHARWRELDRRLALYQTRILDQTAAQTQAALNAYQSDAADFADVMRAFIDDLNTRLDYVRLQVDRAQSHARLAELGGLTL